MRIAAVVLAAGRSSRMGRNKLLIEIRGKPLVANAVDAAMETGLDPVLVVTGHEAEKVGEALAGRGVRLVRNPDYVEGLASSLKVGIAAVPEDADGAMVCLADMPAVKAAHLATIMAAFGPDAGAAICVPVFAGRRGNPVLFARRFFSEILELDGDTGARSLIERHTDQVRAVAMDDDAVLLDLDTAHAVAMFNEGHR